MYILYVRTKYVMPTFVIFTYVHAYFYLLIPRISRVGTYAASVHNSYVPHRRRTYIVQYIVHTHGTLKKRYRQARVAPMELG